MEKFEIYGIFINSFTDKQTGKEVEYCKLYLIPLEAPKNGQLQGYIVKEQSVKPEIVSDLEVGDIVSLLFNQYGKVQQVQVVQTA